MTYAFISIIAYRHVRDSGMTLAQAFGTGYITLIDRRDVNVQLIDGVKVNIDGSIPF